MRISRGIEDRLLAAVLVACCTIGITCCIAGGCIAQPGGKTVKPKPGTTTGVAELTRLAQLEWLAASADAIDKVADRVKSGELKYDSGLQMELQTAFNAGLMGPQNQKLSAEMSKIISPGTTFDPVKTEAVLRATAKGRRALK